MRDAFHQHSLLANPLRLHTARLHLIETMLRYEEAEDLVFPDEADVRLLLSSLQPVAQAQQLVEVLKASQQPEPKASVASIYAPEQE